MTVPHAPDLSAGMAVFRDRGSPLAKPTAYLIRAPFEKADFVQPRVAHIHDEGLRMFPRAEGGDPASRNKLCDGRLSLCGDRQPRRLWSA